jgi:hypothetical protein
MGARASGCSMVERCGGVEGVHGHGLEREAVKMPLGFNGIAWRTIRCRSSSMSRTMVSWMTTKATAGLMVNSDVNRGEVLCHISSGASKTERCLLLALLQLILPPSPRLPLPYCHQCPTRQRPSKQARTE